jgi:hypothetical protein
MARQQIGNATIGGFVNYVSADQKRFLVGTGSYTTKAGDKVFKESVTVFLDPAYDGIVPSNGDYVEVRGDLSVSPSTKEPTKQSFAVNVRFANQVTKTQAPAKKSETSAAPAQSEDI